MGQTRFTLNPKIKPFADELLIVTGVDSYSNLFNLLITKYGPHLKQTWQLLATTTTVHDSCKTKDFIDLTHASTQHQYLDATDPTIERISQLIETF